jgi:GNAT superfamily N-acetyltransferase
MKLRPATRDDLAACLAVCLGTGDSGQDASRLFSLPELLGDIFVAPYIEFCLDFAWVLVDSTDAVCGYVLGCPDNERFDQQLQSQWWPAMRSKYADAVAITKDDADCLAFIASPSSAPAEVLSAFPAHGHIDLLAPAQGQGWGVTMMNTMMDALKAAGVPGMYLDVSVVNLRAQKFYARLGFVEITRAGESVYLGINF